MYRTYIDTSEKERICPLCRRDFSQEDELVKFIESLRIDYKISPVEFIRVQEQMKEVTNRYNNLQALQQIYQDTHRLKNEIIPDLEDQVGELEIELYDINNELEQGKL